MREFKYRGHDLEQLGQMSFEQLIQLLPSRQRRTLNRGLTHSQRTLLDRVKQAKQGNGGGSIKTHARDMIVLPTMVGLTIHVHNGKEFAPVEIKPEHIGKRLGQLVITNRRVRHGTPGIGASKSSLYVPLK